MDEQTGQKTLKTCWLIICFIVRYHRGKKTAEKCGFSTGVTDGQTDGRTDGRDDGLTDGQTLL